MAAGIRGSIFLFAWSQVVRQQTVPFPFVANVDARDQEQNWDEVAQRHEHDLLFCERRFRFDLQNSERVPYVHEQQCCRDE
jgi:hypothetical protein